MRFALWDVLTIGGLGPADRGIASPAPAGDGVVLPARPVAAAEARRESEALATIAGEFHHFREQEQTLLRRQADSLESVAAALARLADGRGSARPDGEAADALRAELAARDEELRSLREAHEHGSAELKAVREELARAQARADRASLRLASTQAKLRGAREELTVAQASWWRRRRARATLGLPRPRS